MIELRQQIGYKPNGERVVFEMDKVYRLDDDHTNAVYLGWCGRSDGACFHPRRDYTDREKREIVVAVNEHRRLNGYPPLAKFGKRPLTVAEVNAKVEQLQPARMDDDDE